MDPNYGGSSQQGQGAPIGFEMHNMPDENPPPVGFEGLSPRPLYPSLDENPGGPNTNPIGFEEHAEVDSSGDKVRLKDVDMTEEDGGQLDSDKTPLAPGPSSKKDLSKKETCYFNDGRRRIDYVLAFVEDGKDKDGKKKEKRDEFLKNLEAEGVELEEEEKEKSQNGKICYIKLHAPWGVLVRYAELMKMKMPLAERSESEKDENGCFHKCPSPFKLPEEFLKEEPDYFTMTFNRQHLELFRIEDKETFFSNGQRSRVAWNILGRCPYGILKIDPEDGTQVKKIGIRRLINQGCFSAAYPLHDGSYTSEHSLLTHGAENDRHLLYETWAKPSRWFKFQPMDLIRTYFGEKIGIYFCWLGFYTSMLIPASIVGVIVFLYGCGTMMADIPSNDICQENLSGNLTMCPLCDKFCQYWQLKESCRYSKITYIFDNPATVFFAAFMCLWATMFLEFWKRKEATLGYDWDIASFEEEEEVVRPEFEMNVTTKRINPVTQEEEPYIPAYKKMPVDCSSITVCLFMASLVIVSVFAVIVYRIVIVTLMAASEYASIRSVSKMATTITAACISLIIIVLLNKIYQKLAVMLTSWENPRTETEYDDRLTFKMFCFQFVNFYSTIFYIAFFKGRLNGSPGQKTLFGKWRQEECDPAGCLIELCIQLAITMVGKQALNNAKEILLPKIMNWCKSRAARKQEKEEISVYTRWEQDYDLSEMPNTGMFEEYLEMVIQYGFVTIFVAAFPLAPAFALINNIIEIRLDAYKYVTQWRRPMAQRAQDIGIWYQILLAVSRISVISNAFIIAFTSDFIPKMVYKAYNDNDLSGYINSSLSVFDVSDYQGDSKAADSVVQKVANVTFCRYRDYRQPPGAKDQYQYTLMYWHIMAAKISFVIVFEHVVLLLTWTLNLLIPDVPRKVKDQMLREGYIAREAIYEIESRKVRNTNF